MTPTQPNHTPLGLLPCPFCGNTKAELESTDDELIELGFHPEQWQIVCSVQDNGCGASSGWYKNPDNAQIQWNTRK